MTKKFIGDYEHISLIEIIVAVHYLYSENKSCFSKFSELCFLMPTIVVNVKKICHSTPDIKVFSKLYMCMCVYVCVYTCFIVS